MAEAPAFSETQTTDVLDRLPDAVVDARFQSLVTNLGLVGVETANLHVVAADSPEDDDEMWDEQGADDGDDQGLR